MILLVFQAYLHTMFTYMPHQKAISRKNHSEVSIADMNDF